MSDLLISKDIRQDHKVVKIGIPIDGSSLPVHLLSGKKEPSYLYQEGKLEQIDYLAVSDDKSYRFIIFKDLELIDFNEIGNSLREEALPLLRELATALSLLPPNFLNPFNGFVETWRFYFIKTGGFLILSEQLSNVILFSSTTALRDKYYHNYLKTDVFPPFALCHQFVQFLYYGCATFAPYSLKEVKENSFRPIPLTTDFTTLNIKTAEWIDFILKTKEKEQRQFVSSAYRSEENLSWFLKESENLIWDVKNQSVDLEIIRKEKPQLNEYLLSSTKRVKRINFLKKRGALIATLSIAFIAIVFFVLTIVGSDKKGPILSNLNDEQTVQYFYNGLNNLDLNQMSLTLRSFAKNPFEKEVSSLFVNMQMRKFYEGKESFILAQQWAKEDFAPLDNSLLVYGTYDLEIEKLEENLFKATYKFIVPIFIDDELLFQLKEELSIIKVGKKKNYWQIENIEIVESKNLETLKAY